MLLLCLSNTLVSRHNVQITGAYVLLHAEHAQVSVLRPGSFEVVRNHGALFSDEMICPKSLQGVTWNFAFYSAQCHDL
jgi:hypothetical protein